MIDVKILTGISLAEKLLAPISATKIMNPPVIPEATAVVKSLFPNTILTI